MPTVRTRIPSVSPFFRGPEEFLQVGGFLLDVRRPEAGEGHLLADEGGKLPAGDPQLVAVLGLPGEVAGQDVVLGRAIVAEPLDGVLGQLKRPAAVKVIGLLVRPGFDVLDRHVTPLAIPVEDDMRRDRQHEASEPAAVAVGLGEYATLQHTKEDVLADILGIVTLEAAAADVLQHGLAIPFGDTLQRRAVLLAGPVNRGPDGGWKHSMGV